MTAFDLSTSYASDWRFHDFVENGDYEPPTTGDRTTQCAFGLKVKRDRQAVNSAFGGEISFNGTTEGVIVWPPLNGDGELLPFEPAVNGKFVLGDAEWMVDEYTRDQFGLYAFVVTKARENVRLS